MATKTLTYTLEVSGGTDIGLVRENNEDVWLAKHKDNIFLLADGMGGHQAGEVAAQMTVSLIEKSIKNDLKITSLKKTSEQLSLIIQNANAAVFKKSREDANLRGMGTTICSILFHEEGLIYAHVGDSRIYRLRNGALQQLTEDHSLVAEMFALGEISERGTRDADYRHIITRAIGTEPFVNPTVNSTDLASGDLILMCSDGLSDMVTSEDISKLLQSEKVLDEKVRDLIDSANIRGGYDNTTVLLVKIK